MPPLWSKAVFDCQSGNAPDHTADIADICAEIRVATKGFGTDEDALIKALGSLGPAVRYQVAKHYEETHEIKLAKLMKKETCNSDFETALQLLASPIEEAEATILKKACKCVGTDEGAVYTTLCGRANEEIIAIKEAFFRLYGEGLSGILSGELGGDLKDLMMMVLKAEEEEYDPDVHTEEKVEEDSRLFDELGRSRMGSDEEGLFEIIVKSPPEHLKRVNLSYVDRTGYSLT